jgi:uncharacterized protein (DUF1697 family)
MKYVALLRGINVGGNRKVPMAELKECFELLGHTEVKTYINSGNVIFTSDVSTENTLQEALEKCIEEKFKFFVDVLIISAKNFKKVITQAPKGFGAKPDVYYSDVAFLLKEKGSIAVKEFYVNPEVDAVWAGEDVVYYRRLGEKRTKSKLSKIIGTPIYKQMTIRSWGTVMKLAGLLEEV